MPNHRLAALVLLFAFVILPLALHWLTVPGVNWIRPYILWGMVIIATWLWQRRRGVQ